MLKIPNFLIVGFITLFCMGVHSYAKIDRNENTVIQYYRDGTPYIGKIYKYYDKDGEIIILKKPEKRYRHSIYPHIPKNSVINNGQLIRQHHSSKSSK